MRLSERNDTFKQFSSSNITDKSALSLSFNMKCLLRRVTAHFYSKKIKPWFKFYNCVEVDETKVGAQLFKAAGKCDDFKWVFGIIDRHSKISMMYHVHNRKRHSLIGIIKKHCAPGSVIFSDQASVYTAGNGFMSKLSPLGYYHFWINHSATYVDKNFPFVHTSSIETSWTQVKRGAAGLSRSGPTHIQQHLDSHSLRK